MHYNYNQCTVGSLRLVLDQVTPNISAAPSTVLARQSLVDTCVMFSVRVRGMMGRTDQAANWTLDWTGHSTDKPVTRVGNGPFNDSLTPIKDVQLQTVVATHRSSPASSRTNTCIHTNAAHSHVAQLPHARSRSVAAAWVVHPVMWRWAD